MRRSYDASREAYILDGLQVERAQIDDRWEAFLDLYEQAWHNWEQQPANAEAQRQVEQARTIWEAFDIIHASKKYGRQFIRGPSCVKVVPKSNSLFSTKADVVLVNYYLSNEEYSIGNTHVADNAIPNFDRKEIEDWRKGREDRKKAQQNAPAKPQPVLFGHLLADVPLPPREWSKNTQTSPNTLLD